jgi:hypothetical protein
VSSLSLFFFSVTLSLFYFSFFLLWDQTTPFSLFLKLDPKEGGFGLTSSDIGRFGVSVKVGVRVRFRVSDE